ncbi:MAG: hypothetical protein VW455_02715 [Nitrospinota bacterium]
MSQYPFRITIPGVKWETREVEPMQTQFKTKECPCKTILLYEFQEHPNATNFFGPGNPEEQVLLDFYEWDSKYQISDVQGVTREIIDMNIEGLSQPNLFWKIGNAAQQIYFLGTVRNRRLIILSVDDHDDPPAGKDLALKIFGSLRFFYQDATGTHYYN